jgi:hypothetical protein
MAEKDGEIARLKGELDRRFNAHVRAIESAAAAKAYTDMWRMRVTELTIERAELMKKIIPGLDLAVPIVQSTPVVTAPGLDFGDMGDAAAAMMGYADMHEVPSSRADRPEPDFRNAVDSLHEKMEDPSLNRG